MIYTERIEKNSTGLISSVGGKGSNLIKLTSISEINVPEGFCITTESYKKTFTAIVELNDLINKIPSSNVKEISSQIQQLIEKTEIDKEVMKAIDTELQFYGENESYAVRSSATAEDLPTASFAGQHDTFLNIIGRDSIFEHIKKCWASLFSERAILYRIQKNFDHKKVQLAIVVQKMISPSSSGIMFTADPATSNRKVLSIDASFGLGEALVSGLVSSDNFKVKEGKIISKSIGKKDKAIYNLELGGTETRELEKMDKEKQTLSDSLILKLEQLGRKIENHFQSSQDIEWCYLNNQFYIVQSRPITTLYPTPEEKDKNTHIYMSAGHLQMMTAPVKPLGMYFYKTVFGNNPEVYREMGGRLYLDLSHDLTSSMGRAMAGSILKAMGDELLTNAVKTISKDKPFIQSLDKGKTKVFQVSKEDVTFSPMVHALKFYRKNDPKVVKSLIDKEEQSIDQMEQDISVLSGDELFAYIENDHHGRRKKAATPEVSGAIAVPLLAGQWLNKKIEKWLGEKNAADTFIQSVPNSVTADAGLALLDVSDVVRKYPQVLSYFDEASDESFFEDLLKLDGGEEVAQSIQLYLDQYGMRCSGDIDITAFRWAEKPTLLIPMILGNIKNFEPNGRSSKHEMGLKESNERIQELMEKLQKLPGGKKKAKKVEKIAGIIRNYIAMREYPKFSYIRRYFIYKQALLKEADLLVEKSVLQKKEDMNYLYFNELRKAVKTGEVDYKAINSRKEEYKEYEKLTPPRLITSEGEIISGEYKKEIPEGALPGVAVSSGIIEGRARVVTKMEEAELEEGDILVTEYTDPSWTPLFVSIKGLVTEVGGIATHGAIIAREYGLPAVVSVENATQSIKDGQMIRVNGTNGFVEVIN